MAAEAAPPLSGAKTIHPIRSPSTGVILGGIPSRRHRKSNIFSRYPADGYRLHGLALMPFVVRGKEEEVID
jgi:hypothetical protein